MRYTFAPYNETEKVWYVRVAWERKEDGLELGCDYAYFDNEEEARDYYEELNIEDMYQTESKTNPAWKFKKQREYLCKELTYCNDGDAETIEAHEIGYEDVETK